MIFHLKKYIDAHLLLTLFEPARMALKYDTVTCQELFYMPCQPPKI
jgi:hypothetical protein